MCDIISSSNLWAPLKTQGTHNEVYKCKILQEI